MCLTIPGKVEAVKDGIATVSNGKERLQIDLSLVFDVKPGDFILYATNRAVKRISEEDAREISFLLDSHYSPVDVSKLPLKFKKIIFKVRSGLSSNNEFGIRNKGKKDLDSSLRWNDNSTSLDKDDIEYLLNLKGKNNLETLYAEANFVRRERIKDFICIHGIVEFSNNCKNDCLYCGIRHSNTNCSRYRMSEKEILQVIDDASKDGYKLIVLQSGEDDYYSDNDLISLVKKVLQQNRLFVFLSVGERSAEFYKKAYEAGATGALIRFETSNERLYSSLRPGKKFEDRIELIKELDQIGYYVATGNMFGLPGQSVEDIARDLLLLRELNMPMVSAGPWIPASGTPLAGNFQSNNNEQITIHNRLQSELALKYIAVARFLMPEAKIPVTTALETLDENGRYNGLRAGANSIMINLTPEKYAGKYKLYDNKFKEKGDLWQKYGLFTDEESWEMLEEKMRRKG